MLQHVFVYLQALSLGLQLFQLALQRCCVLLFLADKGRKCVHLLLYLIIIVEQEGCLCIYGFICTRQLIGAANVVERVGQADGSILILLGGLLLTFCLLGHFLSVLVGLPFQKAQPTLVPSDLFAHHSKLLIDSMNTFEEVIAFQHARLLCHYSLLLAKFKQSFLLALQHHVCLIVAPNPFLLCLQTSKAFFQPLQLRFCQSLGILYSPELCGVQDAVVASRSIGCLRFRYVCNRSFSHGDVLLLIVFFAEEIHCRIRLSGAKVRISRENTK